MSEIINNSRKRIEELKSVFLKLHSGENPDTLNKHLADMFQTIPYNEVVIAEEELVAEGLDANEILKFCDLHSEILKGKMHAHVSKRVPAGHPVDTFIKENIEIKRIIDAVKFLRISMKNANPDEDGKVFMMKLHAQLNLLSDIEKHYQRKENLVFPFLEKYNITAPPMVMWGKHNEIREFLKSIFDLLAQNPAFTISDLADAYDLLAEPLLHSVNEMIYKEEQILFPMTLDTLNEIDWYEIYKQSPEIGFCLFYPEEKWKPESVSDDESARENHSGRIMLSTGSFTAEELEGVFSSLPVDITFVDKDDKVRFFSHGEERIFQRNKAILGRKVHNCHPPQSVHIVDKILDDFKSGTQSTAKFWINFQGKFVHIAYYAVRNEKSEYLGTLEVSQDVTHYREIEGERRLLMYEEK